MSQLVGIFNHNGGEIKDKLATMRDAVGGKELPRSVSPSFVTGNKALAELFSPLELKNREYPYSDSDANLVLMYDGQFYNLPSATSGIQHRSAERLVRLLKQHRGTLEQKIKKMLPDLDGDYALVVSSGEQTIVMRDSRGTKPLYIATDDAFSAFASNKKALWKIGLGNVIPLRAGTLALFTQNGVKIKKALPRDEGSAEIKDLGQAVEGYHKAICSSVRKRLPNVDKVGVLLSGGVDSCLMAKLVADIASPAGIKVTAYTAGLADSPDVIFAGEFARSLGIDHRVRVLSLDDVEKYIPRVINAVEERDFIQIETGVTIYAAADIARQDGIKVIFSGQGPDELWGGYSWYPDVLGKDGRRELSRRMGDDFARADIETLDRENKIARVHNAEAMFPYLDHDVVKLALSVASELKVTSKNDRLGKHPHRQLAQKIGIPAKYANRRKEAVQHSSGVHGILDTIARRNGFNAALVKRIGYASNKITTAKMGSSARYGYRYARGDMWQIPQYVQLYLDVTAYNEDMLNKPEREKIQSFLEKI